MLGVFFAILAILATFVYLFNILKTTTTGSSDNSIDAFIIEDDEEKADHKPKKVDKYKVDYTCEGRQVLILFGTEYGCSEEVAQLLYDRIRCIAAEPDQSPLQPRLVNAKHFKVVDFSKEHACFVIISTSGDGVPPTDAKSFYDYLLDSDLDLSHLSFSVLALGDSNYPQFCKTGRMVHKRFIELGAIGVIDLHEVDMEDWAVIGRWLEGVVSFLQERVEIPSGRDYIQHGQMEEEKVSRHAPFMATLKVKMPLTVCITPDDKETIHCEFDITGSELTWTSGDAFGIYPENNPPEIDRILQAMRADGLEKISKPTWAYQTESDIDIQPDLRTTLKKYYDLKAVKADLLVALQESVADVTEKSKLDALLKDGVSTKNEVLSVYLNTREVADVLLEFPSHTLSWQQVLVNMKSLQPRYYSISSSPIIDANTVCVTAAVVRYKLHGLARTGVTTTFLQDRLPVGARCPVFMSRNPDFRLPSNSSTPVILIGPGTGIAPFMAFIQERAAEVNCGPTLLYFGCRHRDKDYLYKEELERWEEQSVIRLSVAFSRDQQDKIYVQHLLMKDQEDIYDLISKHNASIYVCGDAKHMARDVHTALVDIVRGQGHMSQSEAVTYLQTLEREERYQKDVWVV